MTPNLTKRIEILRDEQREVNAQLGEKQAEWDSLGSDPKSFDRRPSLAATIIALRERATVLPQEIAAAEHHKQAVATLEDQARELRDCVTSNLDALLGNLPSRDHIEGLLTLAAQANALSAVVSQHGGESVRPINARHLLRAGFQERLSMFEWLSRIGTICADLSPFESEITTLQKGPL